MIDHLDTLTIAELNDVIAQANQQLQRRKSAEIERAYQHIHAVADALGVPLNVLIKLGRAAARKSAQPATIADQTNTDSTLKICA